MFSVSLSFGSGDNCFVFDLEVIVYILSSSMSLLRPFEAIKSPF